MRKAVQGADHPDTARSFSNIVGTNEQRGEHNLAAEHRRKAGTGSDEPSDEPSDDERYASSDGSLLLEDFLAGTAIVIISK